MTRDENEQLRRRFAGLRAEDAAKVPDFHSTLAGRKNHTASRRVRPLVILAPFAALAVVLLVVILMPAREPRVAAAPGEVTAWRPGSDVLLIAGRPVLFRMMPPIRSSVVDSILPPVTFNPVTGEAQ